ncbi:Hexose carrier protein HEX6 [Camellia lanceoleosa]|uniref:Hexose carrier protein HEX6 n=1 Tax=Camellia lanceoleosa TaxID=1840588 RepID=A0ACC0J0H6_9ERIC|nr:Hexose carrier protein HEX6 [Camellia lanceoleosa]
MPAIVLTLGVLFFLPETPNSLIQRTDDHQNAKSILQKIRGTKDVEAELDDLINASAIAKTITHPFKKITERKYRPQLVMAIAIPFFQQATGISAIAFYAPILFRTTGLGENASLLSAVLIRSMNATSTFISMLIVNKLGRRVLFMVGGIQMIASQAMVGSITANTLGDYGEMSKGYAFALLALICVFVAGYGIYSEGEDVPPTMVLTVDTRKEDDELESQYEKGVKHLSANRIEKLSNKYMLTVSKRPILLLIKELAYACKHNNLKLPEGWIVSYLLPCSAMATDAMDCWCFVLIASFVASPVTRTFGRRPSMLVRGAAYLAGAALASSASNVFMLILGCIMLGVGIGFSNQLVLDHA